MDGFRGRGGGGGGDDNPVCLQHGVLHHSHEIPVQLVRHQLLQQRLETPLEEHLEAKVVLDDQRGLQPAICYLSSGWKRNKMFNLP